MVLRRERDLIKDGLLKSGTWKKGYEVFHDLFGSPSAWIYSQPQDKRSRFIPLSSEIYGTRHRTPKGHQPQCERELKAFARDIVEQKNPKDCCSFICSKGYSYLFFPWPMMGKQRGGVFLCFGKVTSGKKPSQRFKMQSQVFSRFLASEIASAYKSLELANLYETLHPRALALSTLHSVHRVISSALKLNELIPRIARLCGQILRCDFCAIYLYGPDRKHLVCKFAYNRLDQPYVKRMRDGVGLEGKVAETGEEHFTRGALSVPLIEEDVVGVVTLRKKREGKGFTTTDLEILKAISEQSVIAIKNSQLYEESEQLTLGSIKSINELLELTYRGDNVHLPLFANLVEKIGEDMRLTEEELKNLHRAVYLLDTGKVGISEKILAKKTKLSSKEFEKIKEVPSRSAGVIRSIHSLQPIIPVILHVHERYDGKGYPQGLRGHEIPLGARIVGVVDAFTAMISHRPYRKSRTVQEAVDEIVAHSGTQFDPKVVASFVKIIKRKKIRNLKAA